MKVFSWEFFGVIVTVGFATEGFFLRSLWLFGFGVIMLILVQQFFRSHQ